MLLVGCLYWAVVVVGLPMFLLAYPAVATILANIGMGVICALIVGFLVWRTHQS